MLPISPALGNTMPSFYPPILELLQPIDRLAMSLFSGWSSALSLSPVPSTRPFRHNGHSPLENCHEFLSHFLFLYLSHAHTRFFISHTIAFFLPLFFCGWRGKLPICFLSPSLVLTSITRSLLTTLPLSVTLLVSLLPSLFRVSRILQPTLSLSLFLSLSISLSPCRNARFHAKQLYIHALVGEFMSGCRNRN